VTGQKSSRIRVNLEQEGKKGARRKNALNMRMGNDAKGRSIIKLRTIWENFPI